LMSLFHGINPASKKKKTRQWRVPIQTSIT
jgi:hypothetical protein